MKVTFEKLLKRLDGKTSITIFTTYHRFFQAQQVVTLKIDHYDKTVWAEDGVDDSHTWSLCDAGIIPNNYNNHVSFFTKEEAVKHLARSCWGKGTVIAKAKGEKS